MLLSGSNGRQNLTFLTVCPLVALMDDQVRRAGELGIKTCALHLTQTMADPDILQRIREGQYEMVFVSPEWCVASNTGFRLGPIPTAHWRNRY